MFKSLTSRIAALGVVVVVSILLLVAGMVDASRQTQESFHWVMHSSQVLRSTNELMDSVRSAESGQRGYILTHNPGFAQAFDREIEEARGAYGQLYELTKDNAQQHDRMRALGLLLEERIELMRTPLELARQSEFDSARARIIEGRGYDTMVALEMAAEKFISAERTLQAERVAAAERRLEGLRTLALIAGPLIALLSALISMMIIQRIRKPIGVLSGAMDRLGAGDFGDRIEGDMGSREFLKLAAGYNTMVDRLAAVSDERKRNNEVLQKMHQDVVASSTALKDRNDVIELLAAMSHRMQATRSDAELAEVISIFVPRVLPEVPGVLYSFNNSRNTLVPVSHWGGSSHMVDSFAPETCWALRRGQSHWVSGTGKDIRCEHVPEAREVYHCEPLLASGDVIGVLYLDISLNEEQRFRVSMLTENIASAIVNRRLQKDLKEQTIRDPLTGLFNRRYMEEALTLEIARASRAATPLCVVMCDVDHFKRFNDEHGHDAGDAVLQQVAKALMEQFRDGDIVCRYGGEEFTIIAPGTSQEDLLRRVEHVREAVRGVEPELRGTSLGRITMSFGVAEWREGMDREGHRLLKAADEALYQAKHEGRNKVVGFASTTE